MICDFCGVDAVDTETGKCTYCPGHKARLKAEGADEADGAPPEVPDDIASVLNGSVAQVADALEGITEVPMLQAIRDAELAGKARKGVLAALDARNAALAGAE
jgi:hypothetical protein